MCGECESAEFVGAVLAPSREEPLAKASSSRFRAAASARWRGIILGLAAWLAVAPTPVSAAATSEFDQQLCIVYGDSNLDGQFDLADLLLLMDMLDGSPPPIPWPGTHVFLATDVNGDQSIDWLDYDLFVDRLYDFIPHFPVGDSVCIFPFAGYEWQVYDVSTYVVPNQYLPRTPDDISHSASEVAINSHDEYIHRGIKTTVDIPESSATYTIEMWQTEPFHWQSLPFEVVLPHAAFFYFNWDRQWLFDTVTETGGGSRNIYNLAPGGAQLNVHYFARFEYDPATHIVVFSFRKDDEPYQEVYRGITYWGRIGLESHGEIRPWWQPKTSKIFLLSSDGHGAAHYRLTCQGAGCPQVDDTPPLVSAVVTGTTGVNGWYASDVGLSWNVSDPESGIAATTGCEMASLTANTTGTWFTCSATNGIGLSTNSSILIKIDKDPPALMPTVTGTLGLNGWYVSDVSVAWSVADATSGIAVSSGCDSTTLTTNTPGTTLACAATNGAGLMTTVPVTVKIDKSSAAVTSNLIAVIAGLPNVEAGIKNSLTSKLDSALASLARGNGNAAKNQLAAFLNEVEAHRGKKLSMADADFLIQQAMNAQAGIP